MKQDAVFYCCGIRSLLYTLVLWIDRVCDLPNKGKPGVVINVGVILMLCSY